MICLAGPSWSEQTNSVNIYLYNKKLCVKKGMPLNNTDICLGINNYILVVHKDELMKTLVKPLGFIKNIESKRMAKLYKDEKVGYVLKFKIVPAKENERCVITGFILRPDKDIVLQMKGERRIPLKRGAIKLFLENPGKYFYQHMPKGALFTEELSKTEPLSLFWLYFGIYIFIGLIFGALSAQKAVEKGFPVKFWFATGLLLNILAFCAVMAKKEAEHPDIPKGLHKIHHTVTPISCPECGYENHPSEKRCVDCGHSLDA